MKCILVTGASSGIGQAMVAAFAQPDSLLLLTGRNEGGLQEAQRIAENKGAKARILLADLSSTEEVSRLIETVKKEVSNLDVFIHVAGIWHDENEVFADTPYDKFVQKTVLDTYMVGLVAPALLVHGLLPSMSKGGCLLAVSGTFENGAKGWLPYYGSKRGLEDLWVGLAEDLADRGICVYCVSPSDTTTDAYKKYFPEYIEESVAPEAVAEQAVRLCSDRATVKDVVWVVEKDQDARPGFHS